MFCAQGKCPFFISGILGILQRGTAQRTDFLAVTGDDVVPEIGFHRIADFSRFQPKGCFFEFRYHLTAAKPAEISALVFV